MDSSVRLGRFRGIPIGAHWSLLVIGGLLTFTLATGLLPEVVAASDVAYWTASGIGAILFFGSILAHELGWHAVAAQRYGLVVEDITLWILGGMARLRSDARTPRSQLVIALAGPAASFAAGALFFGAALALDAANVGGVIPVTLAWLALVNAVLAVFNLLPGAPLDGGRVLTALLWMRHGDRTRAAVTAARTGGGLGWALVALGLANVVFGVGFGTLWTALVGWFIVGASRAEGRAALFRGTLGRLRVADVMNPHPILQPERATVAQAMTSAFESTAVVLLQRSETGEIVGIATRDAAHTIDTDRRESVLLRDIGVDKAKIVTARSSDGAEPLLDEVARQPIVVLDDGQVVGVVALDDLTHLRDQLSSDSRSGTDIRDGASLP